MAKPAEDGKWRYAQLFNLGNQEWLMTTATFSVMIYMMLKKELGIQLDNIRIILERLSVSLRLPY